MGKVHNTQKCLLTPTPHDKTLHEELYEARWPETRAGNKRAIGMHLSLGHDVDEIISPTFTADTAAKTTAYLTCGWRVIHRRR